MDIKCKEIEEGTRVGLDFDGVIRKFPKFIAWYADFLSPSDILVRAKLFWIRKIFCKLFMDIVPLIIDGPLIDYFNTLNCKVFVISGRMKPKDQYLAYEVSRKYIKNFEGAYFRTEGFEEKFKEMMIKKLKLEFFVDDRKFVVSYLKKRGYSNAIKREELRV